MNDAPAQGARAGHRRSSAWLLAALLLLLILLGLAGGWAWRDGGGAGGGAGGRLAEEVQIFYTCDTSGQIEPCRCSSGQAGGISRRLGWLKTQQKGAWLLVDAGDVTGGGEPWQRLEMEYILRGYARAGYHAVNAGHRELTLGADGLKRLRGGEVPFVSANVFDERGELIFEPFRIVELDGGGEAGVIGIVDTDYDPASLGAGLRVGAPEEALARHLPDLAARVDLVVLLAFATEARIEAIAGQFDAIDVVVGGNTFVPTGEALRFGRAHVVLMTDNGKGIGQMRLRPDPAGGWKAESKLVVLTEDLPGDAGFDKLYESYKRELVAKDFRLASAGGAAGPAANRYLGGDGCIECHAGAHTTWAASAHAHAFKSLEGQNNHFNPRCLPCHVVGYGEGDGYMNPTLTPGLADVRCESCHGRGELHARAKRGETIVPAPGPMRSVDCRQCHDETNSPGFEFDAYWPRISHGEGS